VTLGFDMRVRTTRHIVQLYAAQGLQIVLDAACRLLIRLLTIHAVATSPNTFGMQQNIQRMVNRLKLLN
jgi:hypothetical protein